MKKILFILLTLFTLPALSQVTGGTIANNGRLYTDSIIPITTATFPYSRVDTLDFGGTVIRNKNGTIIASPGGTGTLDQTLTAGNTSSLGFGVSGASSIGSTTQDSKAILTLVSTTRGFLPPRMTTAQRTAISSPTTGLIIYDTTLDTQVIFNGANWEEL